MPALATQVRKAHCQAHMYIHNTREYRDELGATRKREKKGQIQTVHAAHTVHWKDMCIHIYVYMEGTSVHV